MFAKSATSESGKLAALRAFVSDLRWLTTESFVSGGIIALIPTGAIPFHEAIGLTIRPTEV